MPDPDDADVNRLLADFAAGDRAAIESLMPRVYGELRRLAAAHLRDGRAGHTLQPTSIEDRMHFFRLASRPMRQIEFLKRHSAAADVMLERKWRGTARGRMAPMLVLAAWHERHA
mgnify:CR=1 FL=1